jgi:pimeloyl-ACP methyl ester carboxylesterase
MATLDLLNLSLLRTLGFKSLQLKTPYGRVHMLDAQGEGTLPPLLLFHGLGSCAADYLPLLVGLKKKVRWIRAVDFPGHGESEVPVGGMQPEQIQKALLSAGTQWRHPEPWVAFGNSLGGITAIRYALSLPAQVRAMILASPAGAPMDPVALARFVESLRLENHREAVDFVERFLPKPGLLRHFLAWGVRARFGRTPVREFLSQLRPDDLIQAEELKTLQMPTKIFWGEHDRVLPPESRRFYADNLPERGQFEILPHVGHAPYLDDPAAFMRRIIQCLKLLG